MTCDEIVSSYVDTLTANLACAEAGDRISLVMPFVYPDHDNIEVFVKDRGDTVVVSDLGETLRRLDTFGMDLVANGRLAYQAERIADGFNVVLHNGILLKEGARQNAGSLMFDVLSACMAIADLMYGSRVYQPMTFVDEVARLLTINDYQFEREHQIRGRSGTAYHVDFQITTQHKVSLVKALSARTASGTRQMVNATYRMWSDISTSDVVVRRVSLVNDETKVKTEDVRLLEEVSFVYPWSQSKSFLASLANGNGR